MKNNELLKAIQEALESEMKPQKPITKDLVLDEKDLCLIGMAIMVLAGDITAENLHGMKLDEAIEALERIDRIDEMFTNALGL